MLGRTSDEAAYLELADTARPDVVLLTGGTDGGDEDGILTGARRIAASGWHGPVVVAGNVGCAGRGRRCAGRPADRGHGQRGPAHRRAPPGARAAGHPRDVPGPRDRGQAPEQACRLHGDGARRDARPRAHRCRGAGSRAGPRPGTGQRMRGVVVVDIGGATTDVHSVVELDPEDAGLSREVVATTPVTRTVEGDLGMRWSALSTWEAGRAEGLLGRRPPSRRRTTSRRAVLPAGHRRRAPRGRADRRDGSHHRPAPARGSLPSRGRPATDAETARGSSSAPARISARSTCSWAREGCCGTLRPRSRTGSWAR